MREGEGKERMKRGEKSREGETEREGLRGKVRNEDRNEGKE